MAQVHAAQIKLSLTLNFHPGLVYCWISRPRKFQYQSKTYTNHTDFTEGLLFQKEM